MQNTSSNVTRFERMCQLAEDHDIPIDEDCPEQIVSLSFLLPGGQKVISINKRTDIPAEECLAHELGHCMTDSFYIPYSPLSNRRKYEIRADRWAVNYLVPFDALCRAVKSGVREIWDLAEYFSVRPQFMEKAIRMYEEMGMTVPKEYYTEE